jgi:5,6,7,8-tetrahydromethanopterin hydro-lyase
MPAERGIARTQIGEGFVGSGAEAAHVNTVLGPFGGPVETAWVTALATPRVGHAPFVAVLAPNLPVKPLTLFVNKADIRSEEQGRLVWGAAQAGVAGGVADAVADGVIAPDAVDDLLLVAAVWVDWAATDEDAVYRNNREATTAALRAGAEGRPAAADVLAARERPANAYYRGGAAT